MHTLNSRTARRLESRETAAKLSGSFLKQERSSFGNDTPRHVAVKSWRHGDAWRRKIIAGAVLAVAGSAIWFSPAQAMFLLEGLGEAGGAELATGAEGLAAEGAGAESAAAVGAARAAGAADSTVGATDNGGLVPRASRIAPSASLYEARTLATSLGERYFVQTPVGNYWVDRPGYYSVDLSYQPPVIRYAGAMEPARRTTEFLPVPAPQNPQANCWMFQGNAIDNDTGMPYFGIACLASNGRWYKR